MIYVDDAICSENILRQLVDFAYTQNIQIRPGNDTFSAENHHFRPKIGDFGNINRSFRHVSGVRQRMRSYNRS